MIQYTDFKKWVEEAHSRIREGHQIFPSDVPPTQKQRVGLLGFCDASDNTHHVIDVPLVRTSVSTLDPETKEKARSLRRGQYSSRISPWVNELWGA